MDYSNIFTSMQAEVTLIAVIVLLFLYDPTNTTSN